MVVEGEPRVELLPVEKGLPLLEHDLRGASGCARSELKQLMVEEAKLAFDLARGR